MAEMVFGPTRFKGIREKYFRREVHPSRHYFHSENRHRMTGFALQRSAEKIFSSAIIA
jgi:hypothetical protein